MSSSTSDTRSPAVDPSLFCKVCFAEPEKLMRCTACHLATYCGIECQRRDWRVHKRCCALIVNANVEIAKNESAGKVHVLEDHDRCSDAYRWLTGVRSMRTGLIEWPTFVLFACHKNSNMARNFVEPPWCAVLGGEKAFNDGDYRVYKLPVGKAVAFMKATTRAKNGVDIKKFLAERPGWSALVNMLEDNTFTMLGVQHKEMKHQ